jgi:hypothetical protein
MLNTTELAVVIDGLRKEGITDRVIHTILMTNIKRELWKTIEGIPNDSSSTCNDIRVGVSYLEAARS